jgi:ferritin
MLNPKIEKALNDQINAELYSSYLYLSMSAYFEAESLEGMAQWMWVQAQEELTHVEKFFHFVNERDGRVLLAGIDAPETEWDSPLAAFREALGHEQKVTGLVNDLVDLSIGERDHAANSFLQWFVNEQVEEEATARGIVDKLKLAGDNKSILFMLDAELGKRVLAAPAAAE